MSRLEILAPPESDPGVPPPGSRSMGAVSATDNGLGFTPRELRELLDSGKPLALIDVREPVEWDINHIEGAELIPKAAFESGEALAKLQVDRTPVFYCKTGVRSAEVLAIVKKAGFSDAMHVQGGIVAWGKQLEPDMVMY